MHIKMFAIFKPLLSSTLAEQLIYVAGFACILFNKYNCEINNLDFTEYRMHYNLYD